MALHKNFPDSPHAILDPDIRWFPAGESLRETSMDKLMPPLVSQLRKKVKEFRDGGYVGAANTSKSLLNRCFNTPHMLQQADLSAYGHAHEQWGNAYDLCFSLKIVCEKCELCHGKRE